MPYTTGYLVILGLLLPMGSAAGQAAAPSEEVVAKLPAPVSQMIFSADGMHAALRAGNVWVWVHGKAAHNAEGQVSGIPRFTPDSQRLVFPYQVGTRDFLIDDGRMGPGFGDIIGEYVTFSPNSRRVAYLARNGDREVMVVDDRPGGDFDEVAHRGIFSPDSAHFAYRARNFRDNRAEFMVEDGKQGKSYDRVHSSCYSPDSRHLVYAAEVSNDDPRLHAVDNGRSVARAHRIVEDSFRFSPDSQRLAFIAADKFGVKQSVVVDGRTSPEYVRVFDEVVFSPDSAHVAYVAQSERRKLTLMLDGQAGPEYDDIGPPICSGDSKHLAYVANEKGRTFLVLDGQPGAPYDAIDAIQFGNLMQRRVLFSADSRRMAYVARKGSARVLVLDGKEGPEFDRIYVVRFSPDSQRVAYIAAKDGRQFVMVDGKPQAQYAGVERGTLTFSPDSRRLAYVATKAGKQVVVLDGIEGSEREPANSPLKFQADGALGYLAIRDGKVYEVHCPALPKRD